MRIVEISSFVAADMRSAEGQQLVQRLIADSGALITNVAGRQWHSYATLVQLAPDLIHVEVSGKRNSPLLRGIAGQLEQIVARDPSPESREAARGRRINELYETCQFQQILEFLPEWLKTDRVEVTAMTSSKGLEGTTNGENYFAKAHAQALAMPLGSCRTRGAIGVAPGTRESRCSEGATDARSWSGRFSWHARWFSV